MAKAFSTHPPTPDRIAASQDELKTVLPVQPEYLVTTSEYAQVVDRLRVIENRGRVEDEKDQKGRPTLRKSTKKATDQTGNSGNTTDEGKTDEDQKPTLKRR